MTVVSRRVRVARRQRSWLPVAAGAALVCAALVGCGVRDSDNDDPVTAVREFLVAAAKRDPERVCKLLNRAGRVEMAYRVGTRPAPDCVESARTVLHTIPPRALRAVARGRIDVLDAAGLDNRVVQVSYVLCGDQLRADGSVAPKLFGGYVVSGAPIPSIDRLPPKCRA
jgi:hypothetical protein